MLQRDKRKWTTIVDDENDPEQQYLPSTQQSDDLHFFPCSVS